MISDSSIMSISASSRDGDRGVIVAVRQDGTLTLTDIEKDRTWQYRIPNASLTRADFKPISWTRDRDRGASADNVNVSHETLAVGTADGRVFLIDVEFPEDMHPKLEILAVMRCHEEQVCVVSWRADGEWFATGANDNRLFVFRLGGVINATRKEETVKIVDMQVPTRDQQLAAANTSFRPITEAAAAQVCFYSLAACKAIAWHPDGETLLAGFGSNDRCTRLLHIPTGICQAITNIHAQVTGVAYHPTDNQFITSAGFAQPDHDIRLIVQDSNTMETIRLIKGVGKARVLFLETYQYNEYPTVLDNSRDVIIIGTSDRKIHIYQP